MSEYVTGLKFSPLLQRVRNQTAIIKKDVPAHHGVTHDLSVVRYGTLSSTQFFRQTLQSFILI